MSGDEFMTKEELIELCDARYVKKDDCDSTTHDIEKKLANDDKRLAVIELQVKINNWLTTAIAAGIIALLIKVFLGG